MKYYLINNKQHAVVTRRRMPRLYLTLAILLLSGGCHIHAAQAARRPGASRALRITGIDAATHDVLWQSDSLAPANSISQPACGRDRDGSFTLFFTRAGEGTRNIWRGRLNAEFGNEVTNLRGESDPAQNTASRAVALQSTSITNLVAPYFAAEAAPSSDGSSVFCTSNARLDDRDIMAGHSYIARVELKNGKVTQLTQGHSIDESPAISKDGKRIAFVSDRDGTPAIYVMGTRGGEPQRIVSLARRPRWLGSDTLIYDNLQPAGSGLYRISVQTSGMASENEYRSQFLWRQGGYAAVAQSENRLCIAAPPPRADAAGPKTRLYTMAPDGSGIRSIPTTDDAGSPVFTPDDSSIVFDMPLQPGGGRTLWMLPMRRVPPTSVLSTLRPSVSANGAMDIVGSIFADGGEPARVLLEWGTGTEPDSWRPIAVARTVANNAPLASWSPPFETGDWTFRLTVVDAEGDPSQSLLSVSLPQDEPASHSMPLLFSTPPEELGPVPANTPAIAKPVRRMPVENQLAVAALPSLPLPALPPAPSSTSSTTKNTSASKSSIPSRKPAPSYSRSRPEIRPRPTPTPQLSTSAPKADKPVARPSRITGDAAVLTVSGVPMDMKAGEVASLTAKIRNTGTNGWKNGSPNPVRLLTYWRDLKSGSRTRWYIHWLRADVSPGEITQLTFDLTAPSRPGKFQLRFCLVRLTGGSYKAPPISSATMPGEFGVATTTMDVQ